MKRTRFTAFVTILLCALIALCSCGTYTPATGGGWFGGIFGGGEDPENPTIDYTDEDMFSVTLLLDGKEYEDKGIVIEAIWTETNGQSLHKGTVGANGIAIADGLDGDFNVTLSAVPAGYAYDPNGQPANNYERHITIDLRSITYFRDPNAGTSLKNAHDISKTGVYEIELDSVDDEYYFCYTAHAVGVYTIGSWIEVGEAEINPTLTWYHGTPEGGFYSSETYNGEGPSGEYTKNFLFEMELGSDTFSSVGGGGQSFYVGIKAESRKGEYPVKVLFAVMLNGEFTDDSTESDIVVPTEDFAGKAEKYGAILAAEARGTFTSAATVKNGVPVLDQTLYGLNEEDGWYHLLVDGQPTGPILYAKISQPCKYYDVALTGIEDFGNQALTVGGYEENEKGEKVEIPRRNYKFFIEGKTIGFNKGYFCVWHVQNQVYCPCLLADDCAGACALDCPKCHEQCRNVSQEVLDSQGGYADWCNADGVYPVTKELKTFLQNFAISQSLFFDGNGLVEKDGTYGGEDDQWLFACGYYK